MTNDPNFLKKNYVNGPNWSIQENHYNNNKKTLPRVQPYGHPIGQSILNFVRWKEENNKNK